MILQSIIFFKPDHHDHTGRSLPSRKKENSLVGVCIIRKIVEVGRKKMENYSFLFSDL